MLTSVTIARLFFPKNTLARAHGCPLVAFLGAIFPAVLRFLFSKASRFARTLARGFLSFAAWSRSAVALFPASPGASFSPNCAATGRVRHFDHVEDVLQVRRERRVRPDVRPERVLRERRQDPYPEPPRRGAETAAPSPPGARCGSRSTDPPRSRSVSPHDELRPRPPPNIVGARRDLAAQNRRRASRERLRVRRRGAAAGTSDASPRAPAARRADPVHVRRRIARRVRLAPSRRAVQVGPPGADVRAQQNPAFVAANAASRMPTVRLRQHAVQPKHGVPAAAAARAGGGPRPSSLPPSPDRRSPRAFLTARGSGSTLSHELRNTIALSPRRRSGEQTRERRQASRRSDPRKEAESVAARRVGARALWCASGDSAASGGARARPSHGKSASARSRTPARTWHGVGGDRRRRSGCDPVRVGARVCARARRAAAAARAVSFL